MNQIRQYSITLTLGALPAAILILILYACDLLIEKVKKELVDSRITSLKVFSGGSVASSSRPFSIVHLPVDAASYSIGIQDLPSRLNEEKIRFYGNQLPVGSETVVQIDEGEKDSLFLWIYKAKNGIWAAIQSRRSFFSRIDTLKVLIWTGGLIIVGITFILFVFIARKISEVFSEMETKNLELERANRHLEELGKLKSSFLALVSHELRTPLARLNGQVNLILPDSELLPEIMRRRFGELATDVEELNRMTRNVLDLTRLQSEELSVKSGPGQIGELITSAIDRIKPAAERKGLKFDYQELETPPVKHDQYLLERILDNLLNNAVKYSSENGKIAVSMLEHNNFVEIRVESEGHIVPENEREKIFEKFYRLENVGDNIPGTGLGLYLVRKFVLIMGGRVWVEGLETGNRFVVTLPLS
ncbi:MAG: hypothetical protein HQM10_19390 [Candidatus Riflebacteria bacterium]|nr:hypothetical protein [Candidatus Riflebacteria bacterium]